MLAPVPIVLKPLTEIDIGARTIVGAAVPVGP